MSRERSTFNRVYLVLLTQMGIDSRRIIADAKLTDLIPGEDDMVDLEFALEQELQVEIRIDKLGKDATVGQLAAIIDGLLEKKS